MNESFSYIKKQIIKNIDSENIQKFFFEMFDSKNYSIKNKYLFFFDTINNMFMTDDMRITFIDIFSNIQKTYLGFSKVAYLYKYNKSKMLVENDLGMNILNKNKKTTICIYQENGRYLFNIFDLTNIINKNLSNSPMFFSEPLISKNPYNNIPFNKSTLYNIYFHLREKLLSIPELFEKFFLLNFNLKDFYLKYEYLIREHAIENYADNTFIDTLYKNVIRMINEFNKFNKSHKHKIEIVISSGFPEKKLVEIMRPYLKLYLHSKYSLIGIKRVQSKELLIKKLTAFYNYNKSFGRRFIKLNYYYDKNGKKHIKSNVEHYDDKAINFYIKETNFLNNHLNYEENEENEDNDDDDDDHDDVDDVDDEDNEVNDNAIAPNAATNETELLSFTQPHLLTFYIPQEQIFQGLNLFLATSSLQNNNNEIVSNNDNNDEITSNNDNNDNNDDITSNNEYEYEYDYEDDNSIS